MRDYTNAGHLNNQPDIIDQIIAYIDSSFTSPITLEHLSAKYHISLSHLCRQIKRATGCNYRDYVARKRINYACDLQRVTKKPTGEIAVLCGYSDEFYFSRVFKKWIGVSPTIYRKGKPLNEE